ncbi:hypothetical protein T265_01072 [Opisthorchis viverrini]|uniref:Uncharacterized protein n=1 Tax=Opisthorchis viverrini TaxID=6198 RepID=A0A075AAZ1_OPIVI|nr:hypothetical protein T265_01072 [Opisthorchis viverrini]KER32985.1 hypothetical protein T265_01072 [Opisthorchis viverrini]
MHLGVQKYKKTSTTYNINLTFSHSFDQSDLLYVWKERIFTSTYAVNKEAPPGSHKLISLTSILCEVMERVPKPATLNHLHTGDVLSGCTDIRTKLNYHMNPQLLDLLTSLVAYILAFSRLFYADGHKVGSTNDNAPQTDQGAAEQWSLDRHLILNDEKRLHM